MTTPLSAAASPVSARANGSRKGLTLDVLASRRAADLKALYRGASVSTSMRAADGPLAGRMLAVRGLDSGAPFEWLGQFAASDAFVWGGKTFTSQDARRGEGINRVKLPGILGNQNLFPFWTLFGASAIDGAPTLILDYDRPENPPYIRKIHDEIREVEAGLFLGPAMWKTARGPNTLLWFGLDARGL